MARILGTIDSSKIGNLGPSAYISVVSALNSTTLNNSRSNAFKGTTGIGGGVGSGLGGGPGYWTQNVKQAQFTSAKRFTNYASTTNYGTLVDSSGNVYMAFGFSPTYITKISASGVVQWTRNYYINYITLAAISSDDSLLFTYTTPGTEIDRVMAINTSDGTPAWTRHRNENSGGMSLANNTGAGSSPSYFFNVGYERSGGNIGYLRVWSTSGTLQWQRNIGDGVAINASGDFNNNIYYGGYQGTNAPAWLVKVNSSGTLQWSKVLASYEAYPGGVAVDSLSNVYATLSDNTRGYIIKMNSSGAVQWVREFSGPSGAASGIGPISLYNDSYLYATINISNGTFNSAYQALLPTDGSKTGTYNVGGTNITYSSSALSVTNGSLSLGTSTSTYTNISQSGDTTTDPTLTDMANSKSVTLL